MEGYIFRDKRVCLHNSICCNDSYLQLGNHASNLTEEELETHTISAWKEGRVQLNRPAEGHVRAFEWHLIHVSGRSGFNLHIFA